MSLLLLDEPVLAPVPAPRSWEGEGRPRWRAEPPAGVTTIEKAAPAAAAPKRAGARVADLLLTVAALVGLVTMGITVAAHMTGLRPLVVKSGSMEPTIPTGGMVLVRAVPAADVEVGDIVAVKRPDNTRVTHRVVDIVLKGATAELTLKGDANEDPDPIPVTVVEAGEVVFSAPAIGRVSAFLASAKGGFLLGVVCTSIALPALRRRTASS